MGLHTRAAGSATSASVYQGDSYSRVNAAAEAITELDLSSTPAGADITVDGNFVGNTPSTVTVPAGDHAISVKMAGYQPWERTIPTSGG